MSLSDYYRSSECAFPKAGKPAKVVSEPQKAKGIIATERHKKKLKQARTKAVIREHVRELDGYRCRWPECECSPETTAGALEIAHWQAEGAGGDPMLNRYVPENLIALCRHMHRDGPKSLHSGNARLEPLSERGMRGPVMCLQRDDSESHRWYVVGISEPPKVTE